MVAFDYIEIIKVVFSNVCSTFWIKCINTDVDNRVTILFLEWTSEWDNFFFCNQKFCYIYTSRAQKEENMTALQLSFPKAELAYAHFVEPPPQKPPKTARGISSSLHTTRIFWTNAETGDGGGGSRGLARPAKRLLTTVHRNYSHRHCGPHTSPFPAIAWHMHLLWDSDPKSTAHIHASAISAIILPQKCGVSQRTMTPYLPLT